MVVEMDDMLLDGRMATRANLAGYHLQAAVSFARHAHELESKIRDLPFGDASLPISPNRSRRPTTAELLSIPQHKLDCGPPRLSDAATGPGRP
jgi:hypothetical protein